MPDDAYSDETYGHRRVHTELVRWGQRCTPELVPSIIRDLGLTPRQRGRGGAA